MLTKEQIDDIERTFNAAGRVDPSLLRELVEMARGALRIDEHLAEQQQKFTAQVKSSPTEQTRVRDLERWLLKEQTKRRAIEDAGRSVVNAWSKEERVGPIANAVESLKKAIDE